MKTAILYASVHHGNTKKVVEAMAEPLQAELIDVAEARDIDLSQYDLIGFASGAFYGSMHKAILSRIDQTDFAPGQKAFTVTTCGAAFRNYAAGAAKKLEAKGVEYLGNFQCRGWDTFGPLRLIGGIAKKHPDANDLENARAFARQIAARQ